MVDVQNSLDEFIRTNTQNFSNLLTTIDQRVNSQLKELRAMIMSLKPSGEPSTKAVIETNEGRNEVNEIPRSQTMKLEVPKFDGTDPFSWTFKIEEYFNYHNTPEDQRLRIVFFHMEGKASTWFQWLKSNNFLSTWSEFFQKVNLRFGASQFEDFVGKLSKLVQKTTVAEFQYEFEDLMYKVRGVSETLLISFYISGLKPHIKRELQLNRPQTLDEVFSLARVYEENTKKIKKVGL